MSDYDILNGLMHSRYSCRAFKPDPVPRETIDQILTAAGRAPSWCNAQPWQVIVTSGSETEGFRACLAKAMTGPDAPDVEFPTSYSGVYKDRRREVGWQLYDAVGVTKGDRAGSARQSARNFTFFDAPHVALIHSPRELGPYGVMDCGGYVMAFTLAANALGLASVPQAAVAAYSGALHDHFDIADDRSVVCAISFGYADPDHPANSFRANRADLADIATYLE